MAEQPQNSNELIQSEPSSALAMKIMLVVAGIVGAVSTFILVMERIALYTDPQHKTSCDISPFISCGSVMASWQAKLLGFPNQFIGIVAFTVVLLTAALFISKVVLPRWYWLSLFTGTTLGLALVVWLWHQSLYSIGALCLYCIAVWCVMIPLWILMARYFAARGYLGRWAQQNLAVFLDDWWWIVLIAVYAGLILSIFLRFDFYWLSLL